MRVLVTYGSKRGGTAGLAEMIAEALERRGFEVEVRPAARMADLDRFDAVVVGGALYANRWHKAARRFAKRHAAVLRAKPVWLFSSGPLDDSARTGDIPPTDIVRTAMDLVGARGHMTFGGRLSPDATGFPASAMAKTKAGDWRDEAHVAEWADTLREALTGVKTG